jgi:hypothetical protein
MTCKQSINLFTNPNPFYNQTYCMTIWMLTIILISFQCSFLFINSQLLYCHADLFFSIKVHSIVTLHVSHEIGCLQLNLCLLFPADDCQFCLKHVVKQWSRLWSRLVEFLWCCNMNTLLHHCFWRTVFCSFKLWMLVSRKQFFLSQEGWVLTAYSRYNASYVYSLSIFLSDGFLLDIRYGWYLYTSKSQAMWFLLIQIS